MTARKQQDLIPSWGNDIIHCDTSCCAEDTFYVGCDDDDYEDPSIRQRRLALAGQRFLDGGVPFISTSTLKGPFDKSNGWKNPWAKQRSHQTLSPINASADTVPPVPAKKYTRNNKGKRIAKKHQDVPECYLPSPESLKQESIAGTGHPFLDDDELNAVCSWRDNVAAPPVYVDDPLANKQNTRQRNWLKTSIRKRKFEEYSPQEPKGLASSRRHQFSDNIAANKPRAGPQLKSFSSAPAQLNAPERFYRSPTSSSRKGHHYGSQKKERPATRKAHRPSSESEDELSQDQQGATLSSPMSLKLHKTTLIKQNSSPLKNQLHLNGSRDKKKSLPPLQCVSPRKSTRLISTKESQAATDISDEDHGQEAREEPVYRDENSPETSPKANDPVTRDDIPIGEPSHTDQGEESGDEVESNPDVHAEQVMISDEPPSPTVQPQSVESFAEPEAAQEAEISTSMTVEPTLNDATQEASEISEDEQAALSDAASDELSEVASEDIPSSVCREITAQLRSDAAFRDEDTQSVTTTCNDVDDEGSLVSVMDSAEASPDAIEDYSSPQPTMLEDSPTVGVKEVNKKTLSATEVQQNGSKEEDLSQSLDDESSNCSLSNVCAPLEEALGELDEQGTVEVRDDTVVSEPKDVSPQQDGEPTLEAATTPEAEKADVGHTVMTPINTPSQERQPEFSLRNVIQRLVPSSPWARLSQVASLALAMRQNGTAEDDTGYGLDEQEHSEADAKETQILVGGTPVKELQAVSQAVAADTVSGNVINTESNNCGTESCGEGEASKSPVVSSQVDCRTITGRCLTPVEALIHTPMAVGETCNEDAPFEVKVAPKSADSVMQSVEDASPVLANTSRCTSPEKDLPASQAAGWMDNVPILTERKCNSAQPLDEGPSARSTPEPKFNFTSFSSFASPIQIRRAKKPLYSSKRGAKRGILRHPFNEPRQQKTVTWSTVLERTKDSETEINRSLRERSPPPAAALSELPTANNDKFNKHFSAVVKRTDGLRHKFRSYTNGQRTKVADHDEQECTQEDSREDSQEDIPTSNIPRVQYSDVVNHLDNEEREISEEPMDVVEDLFAEMGDFLQAFDVDTELVQARKESAAQQSVV